MADKFDKLMQEGTPESLRQAYEELWAYEQGRTEGPSVTSDADVRVSIDWEALEKIALRKTPLELLTHAVESVPMWVSRGLMIAAVLLAPIALVLVHQWASQELTDATFSQTLAIVVVIAAAVTLSALVLGIGACQAWAYSRTEGSPVLFPRRKESPSVSPRTRPTKRE